MGRGACLQSEFNPWDPYSRTELAPQSCPLTNLCMPWACMCAHTHTETGSGEMANSEMRNSSPVNQELQLFLPPPSAVHHASFTSARQRSFLVSAVLLLPSVCLESCSTRRSTSFRETSLCQSCLISAAFQTTQIFHLHITIGLSCLPSTDTFRSPSVFYGSSTSHY